MFNPHTPVGSMSACSPNSHTRTHVCVCRQSLKSFYQDLYKILKKHAITTILWCCFVLIITINILSTVYTSSIKKLRFYWSRVFRRAPRFLLSPPPLDSGCSTTPGIYAAASPSVRRPILSFAAFWVWEAVRVISVHFGPLRFQGLKILWSLETKKYKDRLLNVNRIPVLGTVWRWSEIVSMFCPVNLGEWRFRLVQFLILQDWLCIYDTWWLLCSFCIMCEKLCGLIELYKAESRVGLE